jgi:hypothetical protein
LTKETWRNGTAGHPRLLPQIRCPQMAAKAALAHLLPATVFLVTASRPV